MGKTKELKLWDPTNPMVLKVCGEFFAMVGGLALKAVEMHVY